MATIAPCSSENYWKSPQVKEKEEKEKKKAKNENTNKRKSN